MGKLDKKHREKVFGLRMSLEDVRGHFHFRIKLLRPADVEIFDYFRNVSCDCPTEFDVIRDFGSVYSVD